VFGHNRIQYKTLDQVRLMRRAGIVVADALSAVRAAIRPGATTGELDALAEDTIRTAGAVPSFIGVMGGGGTPYPATLCVSVNDEVVHGIPGSRTLAAGDVVSVDCGAVLDGWHGDAAFTAVLPGEDGRDDARDGDLNSVTEESLWRGIAAVGRPARLNVIGTAIEDYVAGRYGLVEEYGGHGIGSEMHQEPQIFNYRTRSCGPRLQPGMCLAIEPMLTVGNPEVAVRSDEWTVATVDGSRAAHWEHTVALLPDGLWVLTAPDGGVERLADMGVRVSAEAF
jgi:methionyl aminopeptidase